MTRTATSDATAAIELLAKMLADSPALKVPYCAAEPQRHDCDDGGGIAECHRCVMSSVRKARIRRDTV